MPDARVREDSRPRTGEPAGPLTPEAIVRTYTPAVWGVCLAHTRDVHDSEDLMQDVFIKAFTRLGTLKDPSRIRGWLLQIARRACVDHHRRRRVERRVLDESHAEAHVVDDRVLRIHTAISKLDEPYREPITLYYLDGRDCRGVAQALGISETAVRSRLSRARLQLHEILREDES